MRVLIISTVEMGRHGIPAVIMSYYRLCRDDVQFDLFAHRYIDKEYEREFLENNSEVYVLDRKKNLIGYLCKLSEVLKKKNYQVVHVHGNSATMELELGVAKVCGIGVRIAHCHNSQCDHVIMHNILKSRFRHDYTIALACSEMAGDWIFGKNNYIVVNNGIEVLDYKFSKDIRTKKRMQLGLENCFVLGHIGLFNEQKNHSKIFDVFVELKKILPHSRLLCVAGDLEVPDKIRNEVHQKGIYEDTLFLTSRTDVTELLMVMDYFIFPSRWEGLGIAAIEAQASGLHCLVSENVPVAIDLTPGVKHMQLQRDSKEWAEYIAYETKNISENDDNYVLDRIGYNDMLQNSQYNISRCQALLKQIYLNNI